MKKIYLMRHGQTLFNTMSLNQGQCDSPLTSLGVQQAEIAKKWFKDNKIIFEAVYSSSLERTCDTTEIVTDLPYTRCKDLKEIFLGTWEATPIEKNPKYPYGDFFIKYGGEDLDEFTERIYKAIKKIADQCNKENILIVSHGMAIKRFLTKIGYTTYEGYSFIGNCGIVCLEYENEIFEVKQIVNHEGAV